MTSSKKRSKGVKCPFCGERARVTADGLLGPHKINGETWQRLTCDFTGKTPDEAKRGAT